MIVRINDANWLEMQSIFQIYFPLFIKYEVKILLGT